MLIAFSLLLCGGMVLSFALGWWGRGASVDFDENDADLLREALDAVESGHVIRIER